MTHHTIGILGSGNIGKNAAIHFVKAAHSVYLANSRGPDSLKELIASIGQGAQAATVAEAVAHSSIVLLAVPWPAKEATIASAGGAGAFKGKIVIDATNPYTEYPSVEDLGTRAASEVIASLLGPDARVVKAFNTIYFETLAKEARPGAPLGSRIALPICSNDGAAAAIVAALIEQIGFTPVQIGTLASSRLQEPNQPLYNKDYTPAEVHEVLASTNAS